MNKMMLRTLALFVVLLWLAFFWPTAALILLFALTLCLAAFAYYSKIKGMF